MCDLLSHLFEELLFLLIQLLKKTFLAHIERSARLLVRDGFADLDCASTIPLPGYGEALRPDELC